MEKKIIRASVTKITVPGVGNAQIRANGCRSMMVKNIGAVTVTLDDIFTLAVGDPAVTFPGYSDGTIRNDEIKLTGAGGVVAVYRDIDVGDC